MLLVLLAVSKALQAQLPAPQAAPPRFVVVLDAAHGGTDAGATIASQAGQSQAEKNFTLALSVRLRSLLAARGFSVITTRESDADVDAQHRAEIANHAQALACLTLHASASGSGVHLFLSSLPATSRTAFLPWKTAQSAWVERSVVFAGALNSSLAHAGIKVTLGRTELASIDSMTCPAVAVEIAPEPNPDGTNTAITDPAYEARVATALAAGMVEWRAEAHQP